MKHLIIIAALFLSGLVNATGIESNFAFNKNILLSEMQLFILSPKILKITKGKMGFGRWKNGLFHFSIKYIY
jgi:hypothetical protein